MADEINNPEVAAFFDAIEAVYAKFNMSIAHEDAHGAFIIERNDKYNVDWLRDATIKLDK